MVAEAELKEGDYYVTLGVIFKKPGDDPETQKIIKLSRKVGSVIHTTGKIWKGASGGFWVELDISSGDSGAGGKPGYVMIDANGFGTPGPCLQKAFAEDGPPLLLHASKPESAKAWDGSEEAKEFIVLKKTKIWEVKVVLSMLFGLKKEGVQVRRAGPGLGPGDAMTPLADEVTIQEAQFRDGAEVEFMYESA
eukprot:gnl/TRDRNA2_/TRDRNA2_83697_c0_seq1.p1 gnl/TRDRNA2_/TRDRNA2_83697_c0~~gnl/TRDRNA2_/TRDRNA2_83697_c0_seq1.p1  ORF type:complete len:193 (-),score=37.44 gnl/TRDRNA2_/TRDRNA2_83697_c0_seq1:137-715(-)